MQPGAQGRMLFDFFSGGELEWNQMPDDFERFIYPGLDFAEPSDPKRYEERLIEHFPDEAEAIHCYFVDLLEAADWHFRGIVQSMLPWPFNFLLAQWRHLGARKALQTTGEYLNRHFKSKKLKALVASQWADYGFPPSESPFALHAIVIHSFLEGAWFPKEVRAVSHVHLKLASRQMVVPSRYTRKSRASLLKGPASSASRLLTGAEHSRPLS